MFMDKVNSENSAIKIEKTTINAKILRFHAVLQVSKASSPAFSLPETMYVRCHGCPSDRNTAQSTSADRISFFDWFYLRLYSTILLEPNARNGHSAFLEDSLHKINDMRFTMEEDFGVLPYPKFDETQDAYHAPLSTASATAFSIPLSNDKAEMSAWIMEVMGMYSTDTVRYAAIEKVLMGKSIRDDDSEAMLNLIFDTKFYDLGFWGSEIYNEVCPMVRNYENRFASLLESMQKKTEQQYETVKEYYSFD